MYITLYYLLIIINYVLAHICYGGLKLYEDVNLSTGIYFYGLQVNHSSNLNAALKFIVSHYTSMDTQYCILKSLYRPNIFELLDIGTTNKIKLHLLLFSYLFFLQYQAGYGVIVWRTACVPFTLVHRITLTSILITSVLITVTKYMLKDCKYLYSLD